LKIWLGLAIAFVLAGALSSPARSARDLGDFNIEPDSVACCEDPRVEAIVWSGSDSLMSFEDLAAYAGPILWFSPDEPLLNGKIGTEIRIPEPFPFEDAPDRPVVYFRVRNVVTDTGKPGEALIPNPDDRAASMLNLDAVAAIDLDYFFYYSMEEGLGRHEHDVESVQMQIIVWDRKDDCETCRYHLLVTRVVGKAHGLLWYDNTLEVDEYTEFPMHILVEEGKHASCTDKNGDGYFTPGYDVNRRVNDAWGVRDVLRSGMVFSGSYQAWMAKVREPQHRVFPPLPEDSPLRKRYATFGVYATASAKYELRPFPSAEKADKDLVRFIADKGSEDWPEMSTASDFDQLLDVLESESFVKSLSVAYRHDSQHGLSLVFPLFVVKNFEDPLTGGFLVNRIYFRDDRFRDFAWTLLYTPSASRWFDGYISAGYEWDVDDAPPGSPESTITDDGFVLETGFKFRANVSHSPFRLLGTLTDFWGLRLGVQNKGAWDIDGLRYVLEVGAGTW
jgi:hypothetical protein